MTNKYVQHPVTKSYYEKVGNKWKLVDTRTTYERLDHIETLLSDSPQPFELSHRRYKRKAGTHRFDTYETICFDGIHKYVCFVDFSKGLEK